MMRRLITTAGFSAVGMAASRGAAFLGILAIAHFLGPAAFGQFSLIQTTALLFTTFCALSLGQMATKITAEALVTEDPTRLGTALTVSYGSALVASLVFMVPLLALSPLLASKVGGAEGLSGSYAASSLLVLTGFLTSVQNGVTLALHRVRQQALANLVVAPVVFLMMLAAASQRGVGWALAGYIAAQSLIFLSQERVVRRYRKEHQVPWKWRTTGREDWAVLWRLGLPSSLAGLLTLPSVWLSMVMLSHSIGGTAAVGNFSLGNQARSMLLFGAGVIANAALPMLSAAVSRNDHGGVTTAMRRSILLVTGTTAVIVVVVAVLAPFVIQRFAPAYAGSVVPLQWLLLSAVVTAPTAIMMRKATADGRPGVLLAGNAVFAVVLLAAASVAMWLHAGATGLSIAYFIASSIQLLAFTFLTRKSLRQPAPSAHSASSRPASSRSASSKSAS